MCHISLFLFANFVEKWLQDARCYFIVDFGARIERRSAPTNRKKLQDTKKIFLKAKFSKKLPTALAIGNAMILYYLSITYKYFGLQSRAIDTLRLLLICVRLQLDSLVVLDIYKFICHPN